MCTVCKQRFRLDFTTHTHTHILFYFVIFPSLSLSLFPCVQLTLIFQSTCFHGKGQKCSHNVVWQVGQVEKDGAREKGDRKKSSIMNFCALNIKYNHFMWESNMLYMLRAYSNAFFVSSISYVKRAKAVSSRLHPIHSDGCTARNRYSQFWYLGINLFVPDHFFFFIFFWTIVWD